MAADFEKTAAGDSSLLQSEKITVVPPLRTGAMP